MDPNPILHSIREIMPEKFNKIFGGTFLEKNQEYLKNNLDSVFLN